MRIVALIVSLVAISASSAVSGETPVTPSAVAKNEVELPPFEDSWSPVLVTLSKAQPTTLDGRYALIKVTKRGDAELVDNFSEKEHVVVRRKTKFGEWAHRLLPLLVKQFDYRNQTVVLEYMTNHPDENRPNKPPQSTTPAITPPAGQEARQP
jgi:hypothetical protein